MPLELSYCVVDNNLDSAAADAVVLWVRLKYCCGDEALTNETLGNILHQ